MSWKIHHLKYIQIDEEEEGRVLDFRFGND